ncbi:M48 family metalloprotease [Marinibacterium profundimaris]|nr:M48 family metalloprotease [Marinibacterium profundimaris]
MGFHRVVRAASIPAACLLWVMTACLATPAAAIGLLRDPDIEMSLTRLSAPILQAAGLNPKRVRVLIVDDGSLNAFVIDNQTIFVHYGLINRADTPEQLQAVIAHEAAHISNGHIARRMSNLKSARTVSGLGLALAVAAAAAGAGGDAAAGLAFGTSSSALRSFLAHTRAEEASADQSAARYLRSAGVNPQGLVDLHEIFRGQEVLSQGRQDPYMRSHPLTTDRIRAAKAYVAANGNNAQTSAEDAYFYARMRGKLTAFTRSPSWTLRRAGSEPYPDVRLMREAVAHHRNSNLRAALKAIDGALAIRPGDPYYLDLKGQILLESRQTSAAVAAYAQAAKGAPSEPLILGAYGRALLADGQPRAALTQLEAARTRDFRDARVLRDLGQAYAETGQNGMASLAVAERYALQGRMKDAGYHAERASGLLPRGSPPWQRAQDVAVAAEQYEKRSNR